MSEQNNTESKESPAPQAPQKGPELDLYMLFKQIDSLREEGVPEDAIRAAFNEFMAERAGNFRVPQKRILRTADSVPMMSQADINKMYEDAITKREYSDKSTLTEEVALLMEEINRAAQRKASSPPNGKKTSFFKKAAYTVAYLLLKGPISLAIWILRKLKSNDYDDDSGSIGFGRHGSDS